MWRFSLLQHVKHSQTKLFMSIAAMCVSPISKYITEYTGSTSKVLITEGQDKVCKQKQATNKQAFMHPVCIQHCQYTMTLHKSGKEC